MTANPASDAARSGALIVGEGEREVLLVTGGERTTWLNGVVTCDVAAARSGQAVFGLLLNKLGKIQTDFYLLATDSALLLACAPGTGVTVKGELERMLVMEDAELRGPEEALSCVCLHGPRAPELVSGLAGVEGVVGGALDRTGFGGAVALVPATRLDAVVERLRAGGAIEATNEDWLALRVERRIGSFGVDYGSSDNPHEASLERVAVHWNKGCYLGQEVVFMQDARGKLKRRVVQLAVDGTAPTPGVAVAAPSGEAVGEVTSVAPSSLSKGSLALARVRAPHFEPGARLIVAGTTAMVRGEPV